MSGGYSINFAISPGTIPDRAWSYLLWIRDGYRIEIDEAGRSVWKGDAFLGYLEGNYPHFFDDKDQAIAYRGRSPASEAFEIRKCLMLFDESEFDDNGGNDVMDRNAPT